MSDQMGLFGSDPTHTGSPVYRLLADGITHVVQDGTCDCGDPSCRRALWVREYFKSEHLTAESPVRYIIQSAFHKEVRRGAITHAVMWGRWFRKVCGEAYFRKYCRKIWFEETRALGAWWNFQALSSDQLAATLAGSPKKWELSWWKDWYVQYLNAFRGSSLPLGVHPGLARLWELRRSQDTSGIHSLMSAILERTAVTVSPKQRHLCEGVSSSERVSNFYFPKVLIEIMQGLHETIPDVAVGFQDVPDYVPEDPSYVYDNHTRFGAALYAKHLHGVRPGVSLPSGVDMRWSGMIRGVVWRTYAWHQYSTGSHQGTGYADMKWEDVEIPPEIWQLADQVDAFFYAKLYERAAR